MFTKDEVQAAFDATNPSLGDEQRKESAQKILAGKAANDAYLNSRPELEQLIAKAKGGQIPEPPFDAEAMAPAKGAIDTTAIAIEAIDGAIHAAEQTAEDMTGTKTVEEALKAAIEKGTQEALKVLGKVV